MEDQLEAARPATTLQTVQRALSYLEVVANAARPLRPKDVARELGVNVTTGYHLLNTLLQRGYLVKEADGTLQIGSRVAVLHHGFVKRFAVGGALRRVVDELGLSTGETTYLTGYSSEGVVIQAVREATQAVAVTGLKVGFSGSEHVRASGKAVLAFLPKDEWVAVVSRSAGKMSKRKTADLMEQLEPELERVRQKGWSVDTGRFDDGVSCVAAPYFGADGTVLGSIAISAPSDRFSGTIDALTEAVVKAGDEISDLLGLPLEREA